MSDIRIGFCKLGKKLHFDTKLFGPMGGERQVLGAFKRLHDLGYPLTVFNKSVDFGDSGYADTVKHIDPVRSNWRQLEDEVDVIVCFCGPHGSRQHLQMMTMRHAQPLIEYCSWSKKPWIYVLTDVRYLPRWFEYQRSPHLILSQLDHTFYRILHGVDITAELRYCAAEFWHFYLLDLPDPETYWPSWDQRPLDMCVVTHEHTVDGGDSKKRPWENCVLPAQDLGLQYEVYGRWTTWDGPQYKGVVDLDEVPGKLQRARASFLVPLADQWVTPKYWECLQAGVMPVLYGTGERMTYDGQRRTEQGHDNYRVADAEGLVDVCNFLKQSPQEMMFRHMYDRLHEEMYNGHYIDKYLVAEIERLHKLHVDGEELPQAIVGAKPWTPHPIERIRQWVKREGTSPWYAFESTQLTVPLKIKKGVELSPPVPWEIARYAWKEETGSDDPTELARLFTRVCMEGLRKGHRDVVQWNPHWGMMEEGQDGCST